MANIIAPLDPIFPSPQPSQLAAVLAVALKITAIIALTVLMVLAILFYVEFSRNNPPVTITPAQVPAASGGAQGTGYDDSTLPATQSGNSGTTYDEPAAEPNPNQPAYPLPNNQTAP